VQPGLGEAVRHQLLFGAVGYAFSALLVVLRYSVQNDDIYKRALESSRPPTPTSTLTAPTEAQEASVASRTTSHPDGLFAAGSLLARAVPSAQEGFFPANPFRKSFDAASPRAIEFWRRSSLGFSLAHALAVFLSGDLSVSAALPLPAFLFGACTTASSFLTFAYISFLICELGNSVYFLKLTMARFTRLTRAHDFSTPASAKEWKEARDFIVRIPAALLASLEVVCSLLLLFSASILSGTAVMFFNSKLVTRDPSSFLTKPLATAPSNPPHNRRC
jgi:hypothetical protein